MKPRILVVDDDEAITQQLYWTLADEYDVITANDVKTAIVGRRSTNLIFRSLICKCHHRKTHL
jgi:Response regulator containing CheY-like receiver, AAA-type ATPase, and DNA-binding domains